MRGPEEERLAALERYDLLDTPREEAFDRITRLTKKVLQVPIATVSIIDAHRQWFKSADGLGYDETPRKDAFCNHAVESQTSLVVPDATRDQRFADNPFVTGDPNIRFYAGVPLRSRDGHVLGTLCAIDTRARDFDGDQMDLLSDLARLAMDEIELRLLADRDGLTDTLSRRALKEEGRRAAGLALRHHHDLSCVALDLDHFKGINDAHGHAAGDAVLVETVKACLPQLRQTDIIGRLGGEEFAVLLPHTGQAGAMEVAERMRAAIEAIRFERGGSRLDVTASLGVSSLDGATRDFDALLAHADAALHRAKSEGRNRTVAWRESAQAGATPRRRVLKGGRILFHNRTSSLDCTVRSLSDDGAGLDVSTSVGVPRRFDLAIPADRFEKPCRVVSQTDKHIEVEFCATAQQRPTATVAATATA